MFPSPSYLMPTDFTFFGQPVAHFHQNIFLQLVFYHGILCNALCCYSGCCSGTCTRELLKWLTTWLSVVCQHSSNYKFYLDHWSVCISITLIGIAILRDCRSNLERMVKEFMHGHLFYYKCHIDNVNKFPNIIGNMQINAIFDHGFKTLIMDFFFYRR